MWRAGFFFHEMAFGLLSVFIPLYVIVDLGGSLLEVGIMSALALFLAIPAAFLWGYACDRTRRYKRYILLSFLSLTVLLYLFTLTSSISLLIILYAAVSVLHAAHEAPKNVLIAESYPREEWEKAFALYEGYTEAGWLIGLLLGFLVSAYNIGPASTLLLCSGLNFVAFALSLIFITDPLFIFERSLVTIEKTVDFAYKGVFVASKMLDGLSLNEKLRKENLTAFCSGLVLFSLATSILFTPLPLFFSTTLELNTSIVFAIYVLNSSGGVLTYLFASGRFQRHEGYPPISKTVIFRSLLSFLLIATVQVRGYDVLLPVTVLILMGSANALFVIFTLTLSMELVPAGKAGLFNVLIGVGAAFGSFFGPLIAQTFESFTPVFLIAGIIFLSSFVSFKLFA
jgi:MFS family permease